MRRSAWIFLAAILLPSIALAWMAVRSARDQQVILGHQQEIISQDVTDTLAKNIQDQLDADQSAFVETTRQLLQKSSSPRALATDFNRQLRAGWNLAEIGFAVDRSGIIYSPKASEGLLAKTFHNENDRFLSNRENVEVFAQKAQALPAPSSANQAGVANSSQTAQQAIVPPQQFAQTTTNAPAVQSQMPPQQMAQSQSAQNQNWQNQASQNQAAQNQLSQNQLPQNQLSQNQVFQNSAPLNQAPQNQMAQGQAQQRLVIPQRQLGNLSNAVSNTVPEESDFRRVIGSRTDGALARFLEDKLRLIVWYHPANAGSLVFGAQLNQAALVQSLQPLLQSPDLNRGSGAGLSAYCLAILDDRGKPVALSRAGFRADWKHPFVATEIGEALPHWEAALYLVDPQQINRSASTLQLTLASIVTILMAAILMGGWLMAADVRRQMRLAQQKTDFVSNVSHELKTPLTSIRMFADMLAEGRVSEADRQGNYLRIISAESARLTRLINNVLDFARMERGAPSGERRPCDLAGIAQEVIDTCRPHLETLGIALALEQKEENEKVKVKENEKEKIHEEASPAQSLSLPVNADRDALAQIILNLISNAEKYGGREILVRVRRQQISGNSLQGCVDVLDRGPGIPAKKREAIFEPFTRLDDSLASGVSGSGLGLTLARRMAKAHGGDVSYAPRAGGGSCFTLSVPLNASARM